MRKGMTTLQAGVSLILVLLLAFGIVYGIFPRFERGQAFAEELFPETCEETGRTKAEYDSLILDELAKKSNAPKALALYNEMMRCFSDAEIPLALKSFIVEASRPKLRDLAKLGTAQSMLQILSIYDDSVGVVATKDWNVPELLIFSRALSWYGQMKAPRTDIDKTISELADVALSKKPTDIQKVELLYVKTRSLTGEKEKKELRKIIDDFKDNPAPEIQLYIGLAQSDLLESGTQAFEAARKSSNRFFVDTAAFYAGGDYLVAMDYKKAAQAFESILNEEALLFASALGLYEKIPEAERTIKDCEIQEDSKTKCLCNVQQAVSLLAAGKYCVDCKPIKICKDYQNPRICFNDPCYISETAYDDAHCSWPTRECTPVPGRKVR